MQNLEMLSTNPENDSDELIIIQGNEYYYNEKGFLCAKIDKRKPLFEQYVTSNGVEMIMADNGRLVPLEKIELKEAS